MFTREVPQKQRFAKRLDLSRVFMPEHLVPQLKDTKPHLWTIRGVWYCAAPFTKILHAGKGRTAYDAYDDWLYQCKAKLSQRGRR